jgi:uncharacterized protein with von Willebrand factor type A (vWA) domain
MRAPVDRYHHGDRSAPTYDLECELDHIVSSVYSLGSACMAGNEWDYVAQGTRRLARLDELASTLEGLTGNDERRAELDVYVQATRKVLQAIIEADICTTAD